MASPKREITPRSSPLHFAFYPYAARAGLSLNLNNKNNVEDDTKFEEITLGGDSATPVNECPARKKGFSFVSDKDEYFDSTGAKNNQENEEEATRKASKMSDRGFYEDRDLDWTGVNLAEEPITKTEQRKDSCLSTIRKISDIGFYSDTDEDGYAFRRQSFSSLDEGLHKSRKASSVKTANQDPFRARTPSLVDELLSEIYARFGELDSRRYTEDSSNGIRFSESHSTESDGGTEYSTTSSNQNRKMSGCCGVEESPRFAIADEKLEKKIVSNRYAGKSPIELRQAGRRLELQIQYAMSQLTRQVKKRDRLRHRRERQCNIITAILQASSPKRSQDTKIRFSLDPFPGDPGYNQWKDAMKMVARLPEGIPQDFRKKLWLTLAEKHLSNREVEWKKAERFCFNEWSNPDDDELGSQIVKDLHRTGCSLFCGEDAELHQLMLKRVLLAYARWNKAIGYCQGFNMLAAIILEVMDKSETEALKVMIYMIEGVLPEFYFANNLRGLSVDMAVFRDLLKIRLPKLSGHLDELQQQAREGTSYEPPLTNVFTMQWFLTLFSTCLPKKTVLQVWDLIFLEGNEVLLRTALAIWQGLEERILPVTSADEFYCLMGQLSGEMLLFQTEDSNRLIRNLVDISPFPFTEVDDLREKYTYNITPWSHGLAVAKRGLKILYSDDEDLLDEDDEKIAVVATFGISAVFGGKSGGKLQSSPLKQSFQINTKGPGVQNADKDRLTVDISALRKQYSKLRQRQKQAHIILTSAWSKQTPKDSETCGMVEDNTSKPAPSPVVMNHLLLGKKPLVNSKPRKGPPPGSVPAPKPPLISISSMQNKNSKATKCTRPQPEIIEPNESAVICSKAEKDQTSDEMESERSIDEESVTTHGASICDTDDDKTVDGLSISTESTSDFVNKLLESFDKSDIEEEDDKMDVDKHQKERPSSDCTERASEIIKENSEILDNILRKKTFDQRPSLDGIRNKLPLDKIENGISKGAARHCSVDFTHGRAAEKALMIRAQSLGGDKTNNFAKPFNPFPNRARKSSRDVGVKLGLYK